MVIAGSETTRNDVPTSVDLDALAREGFGGDLGWSTEQYVEQMTKLLQRALLRSDPSEPA
jgi:hypothetical protein